MITLVTGGTRSGKSEYAESLLDGADDTVYIATAEVSDDEMRERVRVHSARRNPRWRTVEAYRSLHKAVGIEKNYMLDCVTNLISRILFEKTGAKETVDADDIRDTVGTAVSEIEGLIFGIKKAGGNLVMVTNEVGSSIVPMNKIARAFVDIQGLVNRKLAARADCVVLTVCGLPLKIK